MWSRPLIAASLFSLLVSLSVISASAHAALSETGEVGKLMRNGQLSEALNKANALLAAHPRDAQLRFYRGLILAEQNHSAEAIAVFSKLSADFPDLPEPYNNLAVLYAAAGQYDQARAALDMAMRTNPIYATTYENLGNVYAKLASQAYDKALQADTASNIAPPKLAYVRTLTGNQTGGTRLAGPTALAAGKPQSSAPVQLAANTPAPVPAKPVAPQTGDLAIKPDTAVETKPNKPPVAAPVPLPPAKPDAAQVAAAEKARSAAVKSAEDARLAAAALADKNAEKARLAADKLAEKNKLAADKAAEKLKLAADKAAADKASAAAEKAAARLAAKSAVDTGAADNAAILSAINGWAKAWSDKDVKTYLSYYAADFQTPKGEARKDWAEARRARIEDKGRIDVRVDGPKITLKGGDATVRFRQIYTSNRLEVDSRKTLVLVKQGNRWYIRQERSGG